MNVKVLVLQGLPWKATMQLDRPVDRATATNTLMRWLAVTVQTPHSKQALLGRPWHLLALTHGDYVHILERQGDYAVHNPGHLHRNRYHYVAHITMDKHISEVHCRTMQGTWSSEEWYKASSATGSDQYTWDTLRYGLEHLQGPRAGDLAQENFHLDTLLTTGTFDAVLGDVVRVGHRTVVTEYLVHKPVLLNTPAQRVLFSGADAGPEPDDEWWITL